MRGLERQHVVFKRYYWWVHGRLGQRVNRTSLTKDFNYESHV